MRSTTSAPSCARPQTIDPSLRSTVSSKFADYLELTKPKISILVLITVAVGYTLGGAGSWRLVPLLHALLGVGLVAAGSNALNQFIERTTDARMGRTANRPLPSGRLLPAEVLLFGFASGLLGSLYLALWVNALTAVLALVALLLYAAVYTPLKRKTSLCTAVGAVPGALPPVLGWTAAGGTVDFGAFVLFGILFLWQFPHFLAIGWIYRQEYSRAGLKMLPARAQSRWVTGWLCVVYTLVLLPVSLLPSQFALAGNGYFLAAVVLGLGYLAGAVRFMLCESAPAARGLLWTSLIYLPLLLLALTWDHLQLLR